MPQETRGLIALAILLALLPLDVLAQPLGHAPSWKDAPVREDGTRDFHALINHYWGKDVTNENNAYVVLLLASEQLRWDEPHRSAVFRALNLDRPGDDVPQFTLPDRPDQEAEEQFVAAQSRPWLAEDYPLVADWLQRNEAALAYIREGLNRPRYYVPRVTTDDSRLLVDERLPHIHYVLSVAKAYASTAYLKLSADDLKDAWEDVLVLRRLAWHGSHEPGIIPNLVAISIERIAQDIAVQIARHSAFTAEHSRWMIADWQAQPTMLTADHAIDWLERFATLDLVSCLWSSNRRPSDITDMFDDDVVAMFHQLMHRGHYQFERSMSTIQSRYDEAVAIARLDDFAQLVESRAAFEERLEEATARDNLLIVDEQGETLHPNDIRFQDVWTDRTTDLIVRSTISVILTIATTERVCVAGRKLVDLALAVAAYRAQHGKFPRSLGVLVPEHLEAIPVDPFDGQPMRYSLAGGEALIYSVGQDMVDNGGLENSEDRSTGDLVVRLPHKLP